MSLTLQREQSHAEVFLVVGGSKLWITSPGEMSALGFAFDKVRVVPDGSLAGIPSAPLGPFNVVKASDVMIMSSTSDRGLNFQPAEAVIRRDILMAGWLVSPAWQNRTSATEDVHYGVTLDVDFMLQMYGPGGLSTNLNGVSMPGHLSVANPPPPKFGGPGNSLSFGDVTSTAIQSPLGVTMNSFALPGQGGGIESLQAKPQKTNWAGGVHSFPHLPDSAEQITLGVDPVGSDPMGYADQVSDYLQTGPVYVHGELNTWHIQSQAFKYTGRGTPPTGWVVDPGPNPPRPLPPGGTRNMLLNWDVDPNDAYPFNPSNPDSGPRDLQAGDYIIMRGPLYQEHGHDSGGNDAGPHSLWRGTRALLYHVGVLEMHPIDWIKPLDPPRVKKTAYTLACIGDPVTPNVFNAPHSFDVSFVPFPRQPPSPDSVLMCEEYIDGRYSDMTTVWPHSVTNTGSQISVHVGLATNSSKQGRFKATYTVAWARPLSVSIVTPTHALVGTPTTVRVHAQDTATLATVACRVLIDGQDIGATDTDIPFVFQRLDVKATVRPPAGTDYTDVFVSFPIYTSEQLHGLVAASAFASWVGRVKGGGRYFGDAWSDWFAAKAGLGIPPDVHI